MKQSAGILLYRKKEKKPEVFLVHPGGPFWKNKDAGAWSIPKGEFAADEDPLAAARREFQEETGSPCDGNFIPLAPVKLKSGKWVWAWALEMDMDPATIRSNYFEVEWPPKSGRFISVPEIDRGAWFNPQQAREKMNEAQQNFLDQLMSLFK